MKKKQTKKNDFSAINDRYVVPFACAQLHNAKAASNAIFKNIISSILFNIILMILFCVKLFVVLSVLY